MSEGDGLACPSRQTVKMPPLSLSPEHRRQGVTAVLGPTNTGKTHLAIERMLAHSSGLIGLPLRLLAREVYGRVVERVGADAVALITGEEKIKPPHPRFWIATAEAMPRDLDVAFVAIDEIQLAQDFDRGHVFTDHLLNRRGREETLVIGSATMRPLVESLIPGVNVISRPRLSQLIYAGEKKATRLPPRSAIVAFSAEEVYAIAELIRRQRGGAAVVMGALSPRTRNAQVELFQSGDVDHIVATDAIGMGLNLDIHHVAFANDAKFDGHQHRRLTTSEFGQIAGRAGRHLRDGTFGTSGRCPPFGPELIDALENHTFEPVRTAHWRNPLLDLRTVETLRASLAVSPNEAGLVRAPRAEDETIFEIAASLPEVRLRLGSRDGVARLWDMAALPDYRKISAHGHAELVTQIFGFVSDKGVVPDDWFGRQLALCDRTDGDIDTLSARISQVRTWTFCANRDWLKDPAHWQGVTRALEDRLSDALHEKLTARFVDRRTSVLMRRLRENAMLEAEVNATGEVKVEGHLVGHLQGFRFTPDTSASDAEAKALMATAMKALAAEIETRAEKLSAAVDETFALALDGTIRWLGEPVARLQAGDRVLAPRFLILADEQLTGPARDKVEARLVLWLAAHVKKLLGPLLVLESGEGLDGIARGIAFQLAEHLGVLDRAIVANDVKALEQSDRATLRKMGVRFGAYHLLTPLLLKPAPRALAAQLWMLKHGGAEVKGLDDIAHLASSGRTSLPVDEDIPRALYRAAGFRVCGPRALRVDILERLADLIRPAIAFRPGVTPGTPPPGAYSGDGFTITGGMTSLIGSAGEDFAAVLKALGYRVEMRAPLKDVPIIPLAIANTAPVAEAGADALGQAEAQARVAQESAAPEEAVSQEDGTSERPAADQAAEPAAQEAAVEPQAHELVTETAPEPPAAEAESADSAPLDRASTDEALSESTNSGESTSESAAEAPPVAEAAPEMIEVWRPSRGGDRAQQGQRGARPRHRGRPDQPQKATPGLTGEAPNQQGARKEGDRPPRREFRGERPQRPEGERKEGDRPQGERPQGGRPPRRDDRSFGKGRPEREGGQRGGDNRGGDNRGGDNRGGDRSARRFDDRPRVAQPPVERKADPNSPFAALAALKAKLEGKE